MVYVATISETYTLASIIVPVLGAIVVAVIGGLFARSGHSREVRTNEIYSAFAERGAALDATQKLAEELRVRADDLESKLAASDLACDEKLLAIERQHHADIESLRREISGRPRRPGRDGQ